MANILFLFVLFSSTVFSMDLSAENTLSVGKPSSPCLYGIWKEKTLEDYKKQEFKLMKGLSLKWEILVIGAGYAGCTMARKLAEKGHQVAILEQKAFLGGHASDYYDEHNVLVHRYGPHIFHTNNKKVFEFLSQFTDWHFYEHRVKASIEGKLYPFPINLTTINKLYGLDLDEEGFKKHLESVREPREKIENGEDVVVSQVGQDLFEKFFKNYTKKQWGGLEPKDLSPEVLKRIPIRTNNDDRYFTDTYQMMPVKGYTEMFHRMVDHPNISLFLGVDYLNLKNCLSFQHLIFTGPIDAYFGEVFGKLPYRSVDFKFEYYQDRDYYQEVGTVNYPNDHDFTRITEFKRLTGQKIEGTTIIKEYPKGSEETKEPFYPVLCPKNEEIYKKYQELVLKQRNVTFAGRLATYSYYNMDQVTEVALQEAEKVSSKLEIFKE